MYIPKRYGSYQTHKCPFCSKNAVTENKQKVPVCTTHKESIIPDQKCICGSWLELMAGKYGAYFNCLKCGNINFNKINLKINQQPTNTTKSNPSYNTPSTKSSYKPITNKPAIEPRKEMIVRSDDPRFFS